MIAILLLALLLAIGFVFGVFLRICRRLASAERELAEYRSGGLMLPGFICTKCGVLTGCAVQEHAQCRCCGAPKPEVTK
jgi:hypothetical protein